jgi:hypothetical protein
MVTARRGHGPRALAATVDRLTRPVFRRRGFAEGAVLTDWPAIVGPHLAARTAPEKVVPGGPRGEGTLHLRIEDGALALELQHLEPVLVERINGYFGYHAVSRLRFVQGPLPRPRTPPPRRAPAPLTPAEQARLQDLLAGVEDDVLRERLESLGRAVLGRAGRGGSGAVGKDD